MMMIMPIVGLPGSLIPGKIASIGLILKRNWCLTTAVCMLAHRCLVWVMSVLAFLLEDYPMDMSILTL